MPKESNKSQQTLSHEVTEERQHAEEFERAWRFQEDIVKTVRDPLLVLDNQLRIVQANPSFYRTFKLEKEETEGVLIHQLNGGEWNISRLLDLLHEVLTKRQVFEDFEVEHEFSNIGYRTMLLNARGITRDNEPPELILLAIEDVTERKRSRQAIKGYAENVVENVPAFVIGVEKDKQRIRRVNKYAEKIIGYTEDELKGFNWVDKLITEEDRAQVNEAIENVLRGEVLESLAVSLIAKDGHKIPTRLYGSPLYGESEEAQEIYGTLVIGIDVTELQQREERVKKAYAEAAKRAEELERVNADLKKEIAERQRVEEELRTSEQRYRSIGELLPYGVWECDSNGAVVYLSESFLNMVGMTLEECKNWGWARRLPAEQKERALERWQQCIAEGCNWDAELRILGKDGRYRTILSRGLPMKDADGNISSWAGINLNITERKENELRLAEAQRIARLGGWELILETGELIWSDEVYRLSGYEPGEIKPTLDLFLSRVHEDDRQKVQDAIDKALNGPKRYSVDHRSFLPDGTIRYFREQAEISYDLQGNPKRMTGTVQGNPKRMTGTVQDITEQKHLQEQLQQKSKMEAIGRLAGGVAHDFNNYLTAIKGYTELLAMDVESGTESAEYVQEIRKGADQAQRLTAQLLAFGRRSIVEPKVISLNKVIADAAKSLRQILREAIELEINNGVDLSNIYADPNQIKQVLFNLVVNAADAMPGGGKVTITTRNIEVTARHANQVSYASPGCYVELIVSDTGIGIEPDVLEHIFEPFFTTKRTGEGTGLGLATVHGIITQSGGFVTADSQPGKGANFHVFLPIMEAESEQVEQRKKERVCAGGGQTLLVVEDEEAVRTFMLTVLKNYNFRVIEACDPTAAIELAKKHRDELDLLLSDVIMPEMNGLELLREIQKHIPGLPALFVSGYTKEAIPNRDIAEADIDLLTKPCEMQELCDRVTRALENSNRLKR